MNVSVGKSAMVAAKVLKVLVTVFLIEGVNDMVGVKVFAGIDVSIIMGVAVGLEAIREDAAAPTDETSWAMINTVAMRAAAMPREAKDLLV